MINHLIETLALVVTTDGESFYAFMNTERNFIYHVDALNYLYNEKINKRKKKFKIVKWHKFYIIKNNREKIETRERSIYENIISHDNNILFLNTTKGGRIYHGILYIPLYLTDEQYDKLKNLEKYLSQFNLLVIFGNSIEKNSVNNFKIDDYYANNSYRRI